MGYKHWLKIFEQGQGPRYHQCPLQFNKQTFMEGYVAGQYSHAR